MYQILLFDMDGTLVDSAEGIYRSLRCASCKSGLAAMRGRRSGCGSIT